MTSEQQLNCVFCKETFEDKETLQIHFRKHADPTFNKPNNKCKSPQTELETSTEAPNTSTEIVTCDVCTEVFPTISKAITHKHKVHPDHDTKYFCEWCGKLFTLKHLYSKHLVNHESMEKAGDDVFHCDSCNVDFNVPSAMIYHNKFFHRQDMELPAIGHSKRQKFVNKELVTLYYCAFCGEEYINKVNLHKHMADDHGDENQSPDEILRCPLCEAIFYHLDAYQIHLTFHSVEDIYCSNENVIKNDITEFTLESVPPVLEKVEEYDDDHNNPMNIDQLLALTAEKSKHKKHKKHKKSKKEKSAITLDQFLNMNADVFGEGLDFQGAEEIPTQVVKKQLKVKPKPQVISGAQSISKKDLDKLKQQGIVVKMKSAQKAPLTTALKLASGNKITSAKSLKVASEEKSSLIPSQVLPGSHITKKNSNDEILSKLMNQTHSQIKIIKKPSVETSATEVLKIKNTLIKPVSSNKIAGLETMRSSTPENMEIECDLLLRDSEPSSEIDTEDNNSDIPIIQKPYKNIAVPVEKEEYFECEKNDKPDLPIITNNDENKTDTEEQNHSNNSNKSDLLDEADNLSGQEMSNAKTESLKVLKNVSENLIIKQVKTNSLQSNDVKVTKSNTYSSDECAKSDIEEETSVSLKTDSSVTSMPKTSKSVSDLKVNQNLTPKCMVQTDAQTNSDNKPDDSNIQLDKNTTLNLQCENVVPVNDDKTGNSLNVLKKLGISVKNMNQTGKLINKDEDSEDPKKTEKNEIPDHVKTKTGNTLNVLKNLGITVKSNIQPVRKDILTEKNIMTYEESDHKIKQKEELDDKTGNSLNVLKKLGITVKSTNKVTENDDDDFEDNNLTTSNSGNSKQNEKPKLIKDDKMGKSLNALKNLGIIVKSSKQDEDTECSDDSLPDHMDDVESTFDGEINDHIESKINNQEVYSMVRQQNSQHKVKNMMKSSNSFNKTMTFKSLKQSQTVQSSSSIVESNSDNFQEERFTNVIEDKFRKMSNIIVKPKIPGDIKVTTPCHSPKTHNTLKNLNQNITVKSLGDTKTLLNKKDPTGESEIFNIDDSDEEQETQLKEDKKTDSSNHSQEIVTPTKPVSNTFRNIHKESISQLVEKKPQMIMAKYESVDNSTDDEVNSQIHASSDQLVNPSVAKLMNNKNISFKNMPNLNRALMKPAHISSQQQDKTIDNSPKKTINSFDDFFSNESSDDDAVPLQKMDKKDANISERRKDTTMNTVNEPNSDDDFEDDDQIEDDSFNNDSQSMIDKLKNFNQNLIIRSNKSNDHIIKNVSQKSMHVTKESNPKSESRVLKRDSSELNADVNDTDNESPAKSYKQLKIKEDALVTPISQNKSNERQAVGRSQNNTRLMNHQQNTVNQEVTTSVKTIQTKTIVQEITTTVTRTIKTVNQEVLSKNQTISNFTGTYNTPMLVQGMKVTNQIKKPQGFQVRQPNPVQRPRTRPMIPTRPSMNTAIRSSPPVSVRPPGFNQIRPAGQRFPIVKNVVRPQNKQTPGKPVRMPSNIVQKKINTAQPEPEGHFSCFKKPKESLIPDPMSVAGESTIHVASSSHTSKSNFNSSTKTVKGNVVMSATQMKSECHTSSQKNCSLGNLPGVSVMKSSQSNQAVKEVNQCVVSGTKRTTLEAIEKLQKLGLSVKKPRVEEPEDSDSEDDDHGGSPLAIESGEA